MRLGECVSSALAGAAEQGSWISAQAALGSLDPLLRAAARLRLRRSLEGARRATTLDDPAHVLRVAALLSLDATAELDLDDAAAVARALAERRLPAVPKQKPWWTAGALAVICALVLSAVLVARLLKPFDARETAAGMVLGDGLTAFVSALGPRDAQKERLAEARSKATGAPARRAFDDPLDLPEGSFAATLRNEFSAYLAQLAQGSDSPLLDLVVMIRLSLNRASAGGPHALAAVASLISVSDELGFETEGYVAGGITRPEIAELLVRVAEKPAPAIREAALRAYASSFGVPLPSLRRRVLREGTPWRH